MPGQKKVNLDAEIGELLAAYSTRHGVRQQHALSAATLFYLAAGQQVRGIIDYAYSRWGEGKDLRFVTEDWVTGDTTIPYLTGDDADSYILLMSMIVARAHTSRQFAKEAREFLEGGKKPDWLFELDPDRDPFEQLVERGVISERLVKSAEIVHPATRRRASTGPKKTTRPRKPKKKRTR